MRKVYTAAARRTRGDGTGVEERDTAKKEYKKALPCSVRYGAGRGGFSLARPRPYTGPGGVSFG